MRSSCELSTGCPFDPERVGWSYQATTFSEGSNERARECQTDALGSRAACRDGCGRDEFFAGREYAHVCADDASRLSFTEIHPDEKAVSAVAHLKAAVAWYTSMGVRVARVMTDSGSCYKSHAFKAACAELGIRHIRTRPYTPKTNGKAPLRRLLRNRLPAMERFIQTALRAWAYARAYDTSDQRAADLSVWIHLYNWHRPHLAPKSKPPISRLGLERNNLLRVHS